MKSHQWILIKLVYFSVLLLGISCNKSDSQLYSGNNSFTQDNAKVGQSFIASQLALGENHTCALTQNKVRCWGRNDFGQLNVPELKNPKSISAGAHHSCAIHDDGAVCWGGKGDAAETREQLGVPKGNASSIKTTSKRNCLRVSNTEIVCHAYFDEDGNQHTNIIKVKENLVDYAFNGIGIDAIYLLYPDRLVYVFRGEASQANAREIFIKKYEGAKSFAFSPLSKLPWCVLDNTGIDCNPYNEVSSFPHINGSFSKIVSGEKYVCGLAEPGVSCWDKETGKQKPINLTGAMDIFGGPNHFCVNHANGLSCFGANYYGQSMEPFLKPEMVSTGTKQRYCIIGDGKLKCRGITVPSDKISNPKTVRIGNGVCVLDDKGVLCWSDEENSAPPVRIAGLKKPTHLETDGTDFCVLDENKVKCFNQSASSTDFENILEDLPAFSNPSHLAISDSNICVNDQSGLHCFGSNRYGINDVPRLTNIREIALTSKNLCAISGSDIICWGDNTYGQLNTPKIKNPKNLSLRITEYYSDNKYAHGCATDEENVLNCWGTGGSTPYKGVTFIAQGIGDVECVIKENKKVVCSNLFSSYWNGSSPPVVGHQREL